MTFSQNGGQGDRVPCATSIVWKRNIVSIQQRKGKLELQVPNREKPRIKKTWGDNMGFLNLSQSQTSTIIGILIVALLLLDIHIRKGRANHSSLRLLPCWNNQLERVLFLCQVVLSPLYRLNPILDNDYIQTLQNQRLDEPTSGSKLADETTHRNVPNVTFEEWSLSDQSGSEYG